MLLQITVFILTFLIMEFMAWFTHKYIMHGFLWVLHADHHKKDHDSWFERNDLFFIFYASVVVLLGIGLFTFNHYNQQKSKDYGTYSDPEIAFRETQKALAMISESVNKGIGSMNYLNEFEQSKNRIFKK